VCIKNRPGKGQVVGLGLDDRQVCTRIGADLAVTGIVYKVSNLILNMMIFVRDVKTEGRVAIAQADMRGDTDVTWTRTVDWLVRNQDKRVGKNPAGYLVASIRSDYQAPNEFATEARSEEVKKEAAEADRLARKKAREEDERLKAREGQLRARWEKLPDPDRRSAVQTIAETGG